MDEMSDPNQGSMDLRYPLTLIVCTYLKSSRLTRPGRLVIVFVRQGIHKSNILYLSLDYIQCVITC